MKKLHVLFLVLNASLAAQTLTPSVSPSAARPGQTCTLTLTFTPSAATPVAGVQNNMAGLPASAFGPWLAGGATTAASKATSGQQSAEITVGSAISAGAQSSLGAGVIATSTVTIPANTPPGPLNLSIVGLGATNAAGQPVISIGAGPAAILTVISPLDVNGDGVIDAKDLAIVRTQALGVYFGGPCTVGDVNGDGKCDVNDEQLVANAIQ